MSEAGGDLELRVLSGLHSRASCAAHDGALLGAATDCDIVLADPGLPARAARLRIGADGWFLAGESGDAPASQPATPFNQPLPLGPVWVTVARRAGPWVNAVAADNAPAQPSPAESGKPGKQPESAMEPSDPLPLSGAAAAPVPAPAARPLAQRRSATWPAALALAVAAVAIVIAVSLTWLRPSAPTTVAQADPRAATERALGQASAAIERLGLASRLHVTLAPGGVVTVSGWVRNAAERDSVAAALAQLWPMPAMRVSIEEEAVAIAAAVLKNHGVKYLPRYDGNGRMTIEGVAADEPTRAAAMEAVRAQLPGMTLMGNDIQLASTVADALTQELAAAGLSGVAFAWKSDRLEITPGSLGDEQMDALDGILARFNAHHFGIAALATPGGREYADSVPFRIRSVVSGDAPFIVLDNGSKLLVGGTYKRYRLTAIEPSRLVFDGPHPAIVSR